MEEDGIGLFSAYASYIIALTIPAGLRPSACTLAGLVLREPEPVNGLLSGTAVRIRSGSDLLSRSFGEMAERPKALPC